MLARSRTGIIRGPCRAVQGVFEGLRVQIQGFAVVGV